MAGCCQARAAAPTKIQVTFPDGRQATYATRPEAIAAMTRAGGGKMTGA